ncbi:MAG: thioredoxin domain-containing protein [Planctomycetes bacterium]|nr:thioredoxin domain-containing protein [Planctomycetota bacterium]
MANKLANSASAFLRAAAGHDVDWHPWGAEPFARAREIGRPVLLDIGASWCHYCHVMDAQCYQNADVAKILNEKYITIRVDCDERPDVDARYQAAVAQMTGASGWPLTAFLADDGGLFYGGSFFPLRPEGSHPGFIQILTWAAELYKSGPEKRAAEGRRLRITLAARSSARETDPAPRNEILQKFASRLLDTADRRNGGFGDAPKFLLPNAADFLLTFGHRYQNAFARDFAKHTLLQMIRGGVHDRIGGGFHRYSTDERFEIPHFEKLLAHNAEMLTVLSRASLYFNDSEILDAARGTASFMIETLQNADGGFAASQDAGIGGVAGESYTWTRAEILQIAGPELAPFADYMYQLDDAGNFVDRRGHHVLSLRVSTASAARKFQMQPDAAAAAFRELESRLRNARIQKPKPAIDRTLVPAWNALEARALLEASDVFEHFESDIYKKMRESARRAIEVLIQQKTGAGSRIERAPGAPSFLADHAALAESFILLFERGGGEKWLALAEIEILQTIDAFWHEPARAFADRDRGDAGIDGAGFVMIPFDDGAHASGNAIALRACARFLYHRPNTKIERAAAALADATATILGNGEPASYAAAAGSLAFVMNPPVRVALSGKTSPARSELRRAALSFPGVVIVENDARQASPRSESPAVAIVCVESRCLPPCQSADELRRAILSVSADKKTAPS